MIKGAIRGTAVFRQLARWRSRWLLAVMILSAGLVGAQARLRRERDYARQVAVDLRNAIARQDSTRNIAAENRAVARLLGDSLKAVERQVVQTAQRADDVDRALARERVARYSLVARLDSLHIAARAPLDSAALDARTATFNVRQEPYTVSAQVVVPLHSDSANMKLRILLDTAPVTARITCGDPDRYGVRTASLVVAAPPWLSVQLNRLEQSVGVCGQSLAAARSRSRRISFLPLVIGVGGMHSAGGRDAWGVFVGSGVGVRLR